jgi:hypothetical protein
VAGVDAPDGVAGLAGGPDAPDGADGAVATGFALPRCGAVLAAGAGLTAPVAGVPTAGFTPPGGDEGDGVAGVTAADGATGWAGAAGATAVGSG